ncbi:MAG: PAS domain-containing protein [Acidobacteriota bacterium]
MELNPKKTTRMPGDWPAGDGQTEYARIQVEATQSWPTHLTAGHEDITTRKLAEEQLRESEERFRSLVTASAQVVWITDGQGAIPYPQASWEDFTGQRYEEYKGWGWLDAIHPDDQERVAAHWRHSLAKRSLYEIEYRLRRHDGVYRDTLARGLPMLDADGEVREWIGQNTDISERKQAERDSLLLADLAERIRLAEDAPGLLWKVTQTAGEHLQAANCFFTEVETGQDKFIIHRDYHAGPLSFAGSYTRSAFGPALIEELMAGQVVVVRDAATDPRIAGTFDNFKQNRIGALIAVPLLRGDRQVSSLIITAPVARDWALREVTLLETVAERTWLAVEKLRLDAQMQRANERFERAEAASRGFVYEWDLLTNKAERTSGLTAMLGYRLDEIPGDTDGWRVLLHPEDAARVAEVDITSPADGEGYSLEYRVLHKDGHYVWVWDQWRTSFDEQQRPVRVIGSVIDISDRKRKEEQIALLLEEEQAARANAERATRLKDEFLGLVSHELRSPLNAINGWIKLLRGGKLTDDETAKALATIERNAQAQNRLIEDLLDVSRVIAGKFRLEPQVIEPHTAIEAAFDTARPAAEAKGIRMELLSAPLGLALNADPNRLQQAIWNLLSNAIKFTPAGGRITVKLATAGNQIEITVIDTGIGIERDFLPYVFERFRQADATSSRKYGGLGLGLAIVRHIVELHGGEIEADSQGEGCGAAFTIKLPLATDAQAAQEQFSSVASTMELPPEIAARLVDLRVLAIDDEEADREMLRAMLHSYGVQVTTAASAAEGFEMLRGGVFDALVCDIAMPGGDGYTFIRQVREQEAGSGSRLPAIALTAYARGEDRVRTLGAGFNNHVSKPVEPVELAIVLATIAGRSGK